MIQTNGEKMKYYHSSSLVLHQLAHLFLDILQRTVVKPDFRHLHKISLKIELETGMFIKSAFTPTSSSANQWENFINACKQITTDGKTTSISETLKNLL